MTPFPPNLPADPDDLAVIADNDWAAFRALDHVETHWNRPGWTPGRSSYHWMVTFGDSHVVAEHVTRCQQAVPLGYDLVDPRSVHLTLGRVAFTDQIPEATARAVAQAALTAKDRPAAFEMQFGPLTGSRGAIRFSVSPWTPLRAVQVFLAGVTREVLGEEFCIDVAAFRPHVSIAYSYETIPAKSVADRLWQYRAVPSPIVVIGAVELVRLTRVQNSYSYSTLSLIPMLDRVGGIHSSD